jgi:hypothetical protein
MVRNLSLKTIADLDLGRLDAAFRREMDRVVEDLNARPDDKSKRKIAVVFEIMPEELAQGLLDTVAVQCTIASKLPHRRSRAYSMRATADNQLQFSSESPDDPRQMTLDQAATEST